MRKMIRGVRLLPAMLLLATSGQLLANSITQNTAWTVDRAGTNTKYRVVAYGDSIYAGYYGSLVNVASYAAPTVMAEYLSATWGADVESIRRTTSGAVASEVWAKIFNERAYMQNSSTRVVAFEMCGNDLLQARQTFRNNGGTCNYGPLNAAITSCKKYLVEAMDDINLYASSNVKLKVVSNLHYPGYQADNVRSRCTLGGSTVNLQSTFLDYISIANYWMCEYGRARGFKCADNFAQFMGADYDRNGDGTADSVALRWRSGESLASYTTRITSTLRSTIRDASTHYVNSSTSYDYIQSDDVHPTRTSHWNTANSVFVKPNRYPTSTTWNPIANQYGHERMGRDMRMLSVLPP